MKKYFLLALTLTFLAVSCNSEGSRGILKTANGGVDWQASNKIKNNDSNTIVGLDVTRIIFDPQRSDVLFASATNAGIYKSEDGGGSWEQILSTIPVLDLAIDPGDSQVIYAAGYFDNRARALVTKDGGKSWTEIFNEGVNSTSVRAVAVNPANPQEVMIGMSHGAVIKSSDGGGTWKQMQTYKDRITKIVWDYNGLFVLSRRGGLYKSVDGGNNFQHLTANIKSATNPSSSSPLSNSISSYNQIAVSRDNADIIFMTTSAGLYRSDNGGNSWGFVSMPLQQKKQPPVAIAMAPNSASIVYVGAGSTIYKTNDAGNTWLTSDTGTKNQIEALLVNTDTPQLAFAGVISK